MMTGVEGGSDATAHQAVDPGDDIQHNQVGIGTHAAP
jgi:hypothetical protein